MRDYLREPDFGDADATSEPAVEWEYVRTRRRPGAPDGSLPVRVLLIDAAVGMIDHRGPGAVSVAQCARRIGVSKGAPYTWFADAADFRAAVVGSLLANMIANLPSHARGADRTAAPIDRLAVDVRAVVCDWTANGMTIELMFAEGGPASEPERGWAVDRFLRHIADRVHDAAGCGCSATFATCTAQRPLADAVLAVCGGFAELGRLPGRDGATTADAAGKAVAALFASVVPAQTAPAVGT